MKYMVLFCLFVSSQGVNNHGHTLDDIVRMVVGDTDVNGDGFVSYEEFQRELLGQFDVDGDGIVLRNDFVDLWMAKYGDNHSDTNHFFDNLDPNRDHQIDVHDVVDQLPELGLTVLDMVDTSTIRIPIATFENFIRMNHPGHGHGR